jgi:DsbC/DsbD-like thiol-disulfide interchange protein
VILPRQLSIGFFAACLSFAAVPLALAASTSPAERHSAARLFQASTADGLWTAGLEITLAPGWKTYWRIPGESGVPPQLDWSASVNLKSITMEWPAPLRYHDAAGESIGYADRVVFPLRIEPGDNAQPVDIKLKLFYAVCKDICIPAEANPTLRFSPMPNSSSPDAALLESFVARIPAPPRSSLLPAIEALRLMKTGEGATLEVVFARNLPSATTDIFIEGHPEAYFRAPRPALPGSEASAFRLTIDGLKDWQALRGRQLSVTVISGAASLAQTLRVD